MTETANSTNEQPDLDQIVEAWTLNQKGLYSRDAARLIRAIYPALAEGRALSADEVADDSGLPLRSVETTFRYMKRSGSEFDGDGNLIGSALTLRPTPHKFTVSGNELYAWCAVDTLFLPGLTGKTANVESICPATGETVRLIIAPTGVQSVDPPQTVVSVTVPGMSAACEPGQGKGGDSASCQSMNYFSSRQVAEQYLGPDSDIAVLDIQAAWKLAHEVWVQPYTMVLNKIS